MQNNINDLVKLVKKNEQILTHRDTTQEGVSWYHCSTFIAKKNILVKGEWNNQHEDKRNAMILLFNIENEDILGN